MGQIADNATTDALLEDIADRANSITEAGCLPLVFAAYPAASQKVVYSEGTSAFMLPAHQAGSVTAVRYGAADSTVLDASTYYRVDGPTLYLVSGYGYLPNQRPRWQIGRASCRERV